MTIRFPLSNGWTISLSEDLPPACVSVAALPSHNLAAPPEQWFRFGESFDVRCHSVDEMIETIAKITAAAPPEGSR